jgi:DNA-binding transcriptional ArsR family regulator
MTTPLSQDIQEFLRALASETRQSILFLFANEAALTVGQVAEAAGIGQSTASEQLALLKRAGLLSSEREGKEVIYRPNHDRMIGYAQQLLEYLQTCAGA